MYRERFSKTWDIFSDKFRYKPLFERGGWWVDTDVVYFQRSLDLFDLDFLLLAGFSEHELRCDQISLRASGHKKLLGIH